MKKLTFFLVVLIAAISCDDERRLPAVPSITFNKIEFRERNISSAPDSLIIYIDFKDGDGDLGLTATDIDPPYHEANYFYDDNGKLLTIRSRTNIKYDLPQYEKPYDCMNYTNPAQILYFPADVVDNTFNIVETVEINSIIYAGVEDTIYFERNEDHYNITVDFLVKNADGTFTEFDWRQEFCNQSFDGRFPPLGDGQHTLEGTLRYAMTSLGFKALFSIKTLKLKINIKDRGLHQSNTIETPEFTLDGI